MSIFSETEPTARPRVSKLFVCITCRVNGEIVENQPQRPGARLLQILSPRVETGAQEIEIVPVECLSNCSRGCTVAVTAPGKWTYVIGALDPEQHADDVLQFARLHQAHADGLPVWRERPVHIRKNTIARVPPLIQPAPSDPET